MFDNIKREYKVRLALRAIARQRVAMLLQPGNVQVIENAPPDDEWFQVAARTAHLRGWVEVLYENLPTGTVGVHGKTPKLPQTMKPTTHYRLTEGGWAVINRSHAWVLATFMVSTLSMGISSAALLVAWMSMPSGK